jgi:hypothetical protein
VEPTDDTHQSLTIYSQTFNCVCDSARIVFMSSHNLPVQHGLFDVQDVEIIFRHLFDGVNGQIVVSEQNSPSDSLNEAVRHSRSIAEKRPIVSTRSGCGQEALNLSHDADHLFLVRQCDHEELVALVEADHAVREEPHTVEKWVAAE